MLVEIPGRIALVRQVFRWAAEGLTDREVATRAGLMKTHVSEVLTSRFYAGILPDGTRRWPPVIKDGLWAQVQEMRARHSRRHPGPATYRQCLWSGLIRHRACGRVLTGHVERDRRVGACPAFQQARPGGTDRRNRGDSYKAEVHDRIAPRALAHVVANAALIAEVEDQLENLRQPQADQFRLSRIRRERQEATCRPEADRDTAA